MDLHLHRFDNLTVQTAGRGLAVDASEYPANHFVAQHEATIAKAHSTKKRLQRNRKNIGGRSGITGGEAGVPELNDDVSIEDGSELLPHSLTQYGGDTICSSDFTPNSSKNYSDSKRHRRPVSQDSSSAVLRKVSVSIGGARPLHVSVQQRKGRAQLGKAATTATAAGSKSTSHLPSNQQSLPALQPPLMIYSRRKPTSYLDELHVSPIALSPSSKMQTLDLLSSIGSDLHTRSFDLSTTQNRYFNSRVAAATASAAAAVVPSIQKQRGRSRNITRSGSKKLLQPLTDSLEDDGSDAVLMLLSRPSGPLAPLSGSNSSSIGEGGGSGIAAPFSAGSLFSGGTDGGGSLRPTSPPLRVYDFSQMALLQYELPPSSALPDDEPLYSREEIAELTNSVLNSAPATAPLPPLRTGRSFNSPQQSVAGSVATVGSVTASVPASIIGGGISSGDVAGGDGDGAASDTASDVHTAGTGTAGPRTISREVSFRSSFEQMSVNEVAAAVAEDSLDLTALSGTTATEAAINQPPEVISRDDADLVIVAAITDTTVDRLSNQLDSSVITADTAKNTLVQKQRKLQQSHQQRQRLLHGHSQPLLASPAALVQAYSVPYKLRGHRLSADPLVEAQYHVNEYGKSRRLPDFLEEERRRISRLAEQASLQAMRSIASKHSAFESEAVLSLQNQPQQQLQSINWHDSSNDDVHLIEQQRQQLPPNFDDEVVDGDVKDTMPDMNQVPAADTGASADDASALDIHHAAVNQSRSEEPLAITEHQFAAAASYDDVSEASDERQFEAMISRTGSADYSTAAADGASISSSRGGGSRGTRISVRISSGGNLFNSDSADSPIYQQQQQQQQLMDGGSVQASLEGSVAKRSNQGSRASASRGSVASREKRPPQVGGFIVSSGAAVSQAAASAQHRKQQTKSKSPVRVAYVLSRSSNASVQSDADGSIASTTAAVDAGAGVGANELNGHSASLHNLSISEEAAVAPRKRLSVQLREEFYPLAAESDGSLSPDRDQNNSNESSPHKYLLTPAADASVWSLSDFSQQQQQQLTADGQPLMPFQVHRRLLGWKLVSQRRRRDLISILDVVTAGTSSNSNLLAGGSFSPTQQQPQYTDELSPDDRELSPGRNEAVQRPHEQHRKFGQLPSSLQQTPLTLLHAAADGSRKPQPREVPPMTVLHAHLMAANEQQQLLQQSSSATMLPAYSASQQASQYFRSADGMLYDSQDAALLAYAHQRQQQQRLIARQSRSWQSTVQRQLQLRQGYTDQHSIKFLMEDRLKKQRENEALLQQQRATAKAERMRREQQQQQLLHPPANGWNDDISAGSLARIRAENPVIDGASFSSFGSVSDPLEGAAATAMTATALDNKRSRWSELDEQTEEIVSRFFDFNVAGGSRGRSRGGSRLRSRDSRRRRAGATPNPPTEDEAYNYPININRSRDRMDILHSVRARSALESGQKSREGKLSANSGADQQSLLLRPQQQEKQQQGQQQKDQPLHQRQLPKQQRHRQQQRQHMQKQQSSWAPEAAHLSMDHAQLMSEIHSLQASELLESSGTIADAEADAALEFGGGGSVVSSLHESSSVFPDADEDRSPSARSISNFQQQHQSEQQIVIPIKNWDDD